ncbi:unnamed protein product, partial [Urochloa humidicola]
SATGDCCRPQCSSSFVANGSRAASLRAGSQPAGSSRRYPYWELVLPPLRGRREGAERTPSACPAATALEGRRRRRSSRGPSFVDLDSSLPLPLLPMARARAASFAGLARARARVAAGGGARGLELARVSGKEEARSAGVPPSSLCSLARRGSAGSSAGPSPALPRALPARARAAQAGRRGRRSSRGTAELASARPRVDDALFPPYLPLSPRRPAGGGEAPCAGQARLPTGSLSAGLLAAAAANPALLASAGSLTEAVLLRGSHSRRVGDRLVRRGRRWTGVSLPSP